MSQHDSGMTKLITWLKWSTKNNSLGLLLAAVGIVILAVGVFLQGISVGVGTPMRTVGGLLLIAGIVVFAFATPRRRAVITRRFKGLVSGYMSRTAEWRWMNRIGLGAVIVGLVWLLPVLVLQTIFGEVVAIIMWPGIVFFFAGAALLIYGVYSAIKNAKREEDDSKALRKPEKRRSGRRFW